MNVSNKPTLVPLTARELRNMHGLSVEEGLRRGYCIEGHVEEYRKLHAAMLAQERRALRAPGYKIRAPYQRAKKKAASEAGTSSAAKIKYHIVYDNTKLEECQDMSDTQIVDKDKVRAQELHQKILIHAQLVAQNLWEMCSSLKEMRDSKLYYQLGYMHFDDYCQNELGIKRRQAYKYISIAENSSMNFVHSSAQIGVTKLALLASISEGEREQLMEQTDVESVTVRELKEQIKGLQAEKQRLETDLSESSEVRETLEHSNLVLKHQNSEYVKKSEYEKQELALKNQQLAAELEDLRNNPLPEDKYRIAARKHDKDMMEFREQADRDLHDERQKRWDLQEQFDDFRKKQQDIIKDMERQLREAQEAATPTVINMESEAPIFEAYLAMAQEVLNRTFVYATGCGNSCGYLERLDDLLLSISSAIDDETGKYADYDDENGGLTDGKII